MNLCMKVCLSLLIVSLSFCVKTGDAAENKNGQACKTSLVETTPVNRPEDWWMRNYHRQFAELKNEKVEVIMLGDSITHFWEERFDTQWHAYWGETTAVNLGIGGDRIQHALWRIMNFDWSHVHPKLAFVLLGSNNIAEGEPKNIAQGNRTIVEYLHKKFPAMKIVVMKLFPLGRPEEQAKRDKVNEINVELTAALADLKYVKLVDFNDIWLKDGKVRAELMPDYVHPNSVGYRLLGERMKPIIQQALGSFSKEDESK